jgi:putative ABC transport system ATP-binding protein
LLDEPTAHLDDAHARSLLDTLASLAAEDRALLVATHDPRVVSAPGVARVIDLANGRLVPQTLEESSAGSAATSTPDSEHQP